MASPELIEALRKKADFKRNLYYLYFLNQAFISIVNATEANLDNLDNANETQEIGKATYFMGIDAINLILWVLLYAICHMWFTFFMAIFSISMSYWVYVNFNFLFFDFLWLQVLTVVFVYFMNYVKIYMSKV